MKHLRRRAVKKTATLLMRARALDMACIGLSEAYYPLGLKDTRWYIGAGMAYSFDKLKAR
jgi:hypothetical protein